MKVMATAKLSKVPETQGIKYAGSKLRMLPHILSLVSLTSARTVFDGFSGTTRVSQAFAATGRTVTANDSAPWSAVFATCFLKADSDSRRYQGVIDHLNSVAPSDGWFTKHYGGEPGAGKHGRATQKRPFQVHNMRKLDAIRQEIDEMGLDHVEKCVALSSLILALDKVDSTLGHFASYLRDWSTRSYNQMRLELPNITAASASHKVLEKDVFEANSEVSSDLSYFDPPYGSNNAKMPPSRVRYGAYYHFWKTVVLNDRPALFGKALRRSDSSDEVAASVFEDFRRDDDGEFRSVKAIRKLLKEARSPFVLLSYSSGGRATRAALESVLKECGRIVKAVEVDQRRNVMASMHWTGKWRSRTGVAHREDLFLLEK